MQITRKSVSATGQATPAPSDALWVLTAVAAIVMFCQTLVIIGGYAIGTFLVQPTLTDEEIANGEGGIDLSTFTEFAGDVWRYGAVLALVAVVLALVWRFRDRLTTRHLWTVCVGLGLIVPLQMTVFTSVFT